jgi:hypothetical protein
MKYAAELNEIQDFMLYATSLCRDGVIKSFSEYGQIDSNVDRTLKQLFNYFSDRSQVISHLISCEYIWDSEMILRSAFETAAKIWFICLSSEQDREKLVEEFWGIRAKIHNRKRSRKAGILKQLFLHANSQEEVDIFEALEDKNEFLHDEVNKRERKAIEQKWSFSEIITYLEANYPPAFPLEYLSSFLHGYGIASHLIHADDCALDLMLDRALRDKEELLLLKCAHIARIWSDVVGLWYVSLAALNYRFDVAGSSEEIQEAFMKFHDLCRPISERFYSTQRDLYERRKQKMLKTECIFVCSLKVF